MGRHARASGPDRPEATYVPHAFAEHTFDTGEVPLSYAVAGADEHPALLLVPGQTEWAPSPRAATTRAGSRA
jgi:hypothetical protein